MIVNGQAVKRAREAKNLSRAHLAVEIGVSHETISRIERGKDTAATTMYQLADFLDVPLESLFTDPAQPAAKNGEAA